MRRFFKSKFFIILAVIAVILALTCTLLPMFGYSFILRDAVNVILTPVEKGANMVGNAIAGYSEYFTEFDNLKEENARLRAELLAMQDAVAAAEAVRAENEFLMKYLEIKTQRLDFKFESAHVIGREAGNYITVFSLDKGTMHGMAQNMPIISDTGLIGYISEAGVNWAKAVSILDSTAAVGAYGERSGVSGIVEGDYLLRQNGLCRMSYLGEDGELQPGDRIYTSGLGSIYPRGLLIGVVERVENDPVTRESYAVIRPSADLYDVSRIQVITSYEKYVEP